MPARLGRGQEARAAFERAAEMSANQRRAGFLRRGAAAC
jgi:predicted RNA polymerase sigma factor